MSAVDHLFCFVQLRKALLGLKRLSQSICLQVMFYQKEMYSCVPHSALKPHSTTASCSLLEVSVKLLTGSEQTCTTPELCFPCSLACTFANSSLCIYAENLLWRQNVKKLQWTCWETTQHTHWAQHRSCPFSKALVRRPLSLEGTEHSLVPRQQK